MENAFLSITPLQSGIGETKQILQTIDSLAAEYSTTLLIRNAAVRIVRAFKNPSDQIVGIVTFVRNNFTFVGDPVYVEYIQTPEQLLRTYYNDGVGYGDCDDFVTLLNSLLNSVGFVTRAVATKLKGSMKFNHVLTEVELDGTWYIFDPTNKESENVNFQEYYR